MDIDNEKEKELSGLIKDTLAGYEEEYVAGAWENFARKQKFVLKKEENRRRRVVYMRYAAGLAACLLLGIVVLNMYQKDMSDAEVQPTGTISSQIAVIDNSSKTGPDQMDTPRESITIAQNSTKNDLPETSAGKVDKPVNTDIPEPHKVVKSEEQQPAPGTTQPTAPQQAIAANTIADNADNRISPTPSQSPAQKSTARKVRFGINVSQGINSTTTSTAFNYSGGVNVDIPLSKTLALSTGMQVENQSVVSKSTVSNTAIPSDNRRASLINLDIPLNIKWKFLSRKSGSYYIAGGISSLAYLSEKYTTISRKQELREVLSFMGNEPTRTYKLENVETTTTNTAGASNQFDIAGRLNISIGFEKQISPSLYLHIEPFMKIPVSGLAAENLIFTTSGITFKISF